MSWLPCIRRVADLASGSLRALADDPGFEAVAGADLVGLDEDDDFLRQHGKEEAAFRKVTASRSVRGTDDDTSNGKSASGRCGWHG